MKLGFVTAILDSWNYEEMMDFASEQGFECVEVACWPQEKAERRYAGVSHIDAERVNREDAYAEHIVKYAVFVDFVQQNFNSPNRLITVVAVVENSLHINDFYIGHLAIV